MPLPLLRGPLGPSLPRNTSKEPSKVAPLRHGIGGGEEKEEEEEIDSDGGGGGAQNGGVVVSDTLQPIRVALFEEEVLRPRG